MFPSWPRVALPNFLYSDHFFISQKTHDFTQHKIEYKYHSALGLGAEKCLPAHQARGPPGPGRGTVRPGDTVLVPAGRLTTAPLLSSSSAPPGPPHGAAALTCGGQPPTAAAAPVVALRRRTRPPRDAAPAPVPPALLRCLRVAPAA